MVHVQVVLKLDVAVEPAILKLVKMLHVVVVYVHRNPIMFARLGPREHRFVHEFTCICCHFEMDLHLFQIDWLDR